MEILCRQAGAAAAGQPLIPGDKKDSSVAAAFAALLETQPSGEVMLGEAEPVEEAVSEDAVEADEGADSASVDVVFSENAVPAVVPAVIPDLKFLPGQDVIVEAGDGEANGGVTDKAAQARSVELPLIYSAARPEPSAFTFADGSETETSDDSPDPMAELRGSSSASEEVPDLRQSLRSRVDSIPAPAREAPRSIMAETLPRNVSSEISKGDDPTSELTFELPDQVAFGVSVHDTRASAMGSDLYARSLSRPVVDPQHVVRQMGEKLADQQEGVIEIALSPEELGKIRLVIAAGDKPAVTVFAERPEIHELLRRNADSLERELRNVGIMGADISFAGEGESRHQQDDSRPAGMKSSGLKEGNLAFADKTNPPEPRPTTGRRIDIRI